MYLAMIYNDTLQTLIKAKRKMSIERKFQIHLESKGDITHIVHHPLRNSLIVYGLGTEVEVFVES